MLVHPMWLPFLLQIERFLRKELRIVQWVALAAFVMQVLVVMLACALTQAQQNALLENERWVALIRGLSDFTLLCQALHSAVPDLLHHLPIDGRPSPCTCGAATPLHDCLQTPRHCLASMLRS